MAIHQIVKIQASPKAIFRALMSADEFSEFTGDAANISQHAGGEFSCFGGRVTGRHIELQQDALIVQAWRVSDWPAGTYSIVRFDLRSIGASATITLEHAGFPEDAEDHLASGWHKMYWEPLRTHLERE